MKKIFSYKHYTYSIRVSLFCYNHLGKKIHKIHIYNLGTDEYDDVREIETTQDLKTILLEIETSIKTYVDKKINSLTLPETKILIDLGYQ